MNGFERALNDCLEALHSGLWDVDECLWRYPEHADALRPMLLSAVAAAQAFAEVEPRPEWAASARERFLIATGQSLQQAMDVEPDPTFFAAARMRFQLAAQRMRLGETAGRTKQAASHPGRILGIPMRALASGLAAVTLFFSFSTYTVASADDSLPGDWQYGVKLQTERIRLALAFGEDSERSVKLDIAEERVNEIERLAAKGKIIGPGVLDRLVSQTEPLVQDVQSGDWDTDDASRLKDLAQKQRQVLQEAQVATAAQPQLAEAAAISDQGVKNASEVIFRDPERPPTVIAPVVELTPTSTPTPDGATPAPAGETSSTPEATPTSSVEDETPVIGDGQIIIGATPVVERNNVKLYPLQVDRLSLLVPGPESGWFLDATQDAISPGLLRYSKTDSSSFIVINKTNGDMYWYVLRNGKYDEVQMRLTAGETVRIVDRTVVESAYGPDANVPLYMMESIELLPAITPTPETTDTPQPTSTAAP